MKIDKLINRRGEERALMAEKKWCGQLDHPPGDRWVSLFVPI